MPSHNERQFTELMTDMADQRLGLRAFALKAGIDKQTLSRLINGQTKRVDREIIGKISVATNGRVGNAEVIAFLDRLASVPKADQKQEIA